jgi:hypothetical protein
MATRRALGSHPPGPTPPCLASERQALHNLGQLEAELLSQASSVSVERLRKIAVAFELQTRLMAQSGALLRLALEGTGANGAGVGKLEDNGGDDGRPQCRRQCRNVDGGGGGGEGGGDGDGGGGGGSGGWGGGTSGGGLYEREGESQYLHRLGLNTSFDLDNPAHDKLPTVAPLMSKHRGQNSPLPTIDQHSDQHHLRHSTRTHANQSTQAALDAYQRLMETLVGIRNES